MTGSGAGLDLLVALVTGAAVAGAVARTARPLPRLAPRLRPYSVAARTSLGGPADVAMVPQGEGLASGAHQLAAAIAERVGRALGRLTDRARDEALARRLHHAGCFAHLPPGERVRAYRVKQVSTAALWTCGGTALGLATALGSGAVLGLGGLGLVIGATRWPARLDRAVTERRERMGIELYTVNQLLALQVRAGSGVTQALQRIVQRGSGVLVSELAEVLALHRSGRPLVEALEHAAERTAEPNAARTYRLLAGGVAYGADLADGLRALADDVRRQRAETLKRAATRRRAAMLIPIIALLAPVMLLFIAAPLPSLVLGGP